MATILGQGRVQLVQIWARSTVTSFSTIDLHTQFFVATMALVVFSACSETSSGLEQAGESSYHLTLEKMVAGVLVRYK